MNLASSNVPAIGQGPRKHPPAKVGDTFGPYTVTATRPRGHRGRSDERVEWKCTCGRFGESYVFNLRGAKASCNHVRAGRPTSWGKRHRGGLT